MRLKQYFYYIEISNANAAVTVLKQRSEKIQASNPRPMRCRCSALPSELSKPHESGHVWVSPLCERNTRPEYVNKSSNF